MSWSTSSLNQSPSSQAVLAHGTHRDDDFGPIPPRVDLPVGDDFAFNISSEVGTTYVICAQTHSVSSGRHSARDGSYDPKEFKGPSCAEYANGILHLNIPYLRIDTV